MCKDTDRVCPQCGQEVTASNLVDGDNLVGLRLADKYELTEFLGEGAMGWVYRGTHLALQSSVAVKIMKPQIRPDEQRAARFKREARAASRLNHPHIISVIDFGETPSGLLYLVTEFLRGKSLSDVMSQEGPLEFKRIVRLMGQILSALEESHNCGVVHRDLKPDNIMVSVLRGGDDFVKVLDFGIAQIQEKNSQKLTQQGQLFGTPDYMAPEQIRSQEVTGAADIYATGVMLFELLTGQLPFTAENLFDVLKDHLYTAVPKLDEIIPEQNYPPQLQKILDRALAKDPEKRFDDPGEFRRALKKAAKLTTGAARPCPRCNQLVSRKVQFCPHCGQRLQAPRPKPERSIATAETQYDLTEEARQSYPSTDSQPTLDRLWSSLTVRLPLVDRQQERKTIHKLLEEQIKTVQLVGTVGTGKTALAQVAAREAQKSGLPVHWIDPHPSLLPVPFAPVRAAICAVLGLPDKPTRKKLLETIAARPSIQSERAGLLALFGFESALGESSASVRRNEAIAAAWKVVLLTCEEPKLIVFEDLDLFDGPSRLFIQRLAHNRGQGAHLCLLVTSTVPFLEKSADLVTCELSPLPERSVSLLVNELFSRPTDSWGGVMSSLVRASKGNPLWLEQALALATESGTESDQALPDLFATRLSRLPSAAQQALQALAVFGIEATLDDIGHLLESPLTEETLQLLSLRGFLLPHGEAEASVPKTTRPASQPDHKTLGHQSLKFSHPFMVPLIRELLPAEVRQKLNAQAAEWLAPQNHPPSVLAHLFFEGSQYHQAIDQLLHAGRRALDYCDASGAIGFLRRSVDIARWKLLIAEDDPLYIELNYRLGEAMYAAGDYRGAQVVLRYAESYSGANPRLASQIKRLLAKVLVAHGKPVKGVDTLRQAVGDAILGGDADVLAEMYLELGELLVHSNDTPQALKELVEGLDLVTAGQGPSCQDGPKLLWKMLARMAEYKGRLEHTAEGLERAVSLAEAALKAAHNIKSAVGVATSHMLLADLLHRVAKPKDAQKNIQAAMDAASDIGDRKLVAACALKAAQYSEDDTHAASLFQKAYQLAWEIGWQEGMKIAGEKKLQNNQVA
jgi:serine/threonine-protein kinase